MNEQRKAALSLHQPLQYTIQKIFEEGLEGNLKPILTTTNMVKSNKSGKSSNHKSQLFRNQESTIKIEMNNSIKILRTESSEKTRTIPVRIVHKQPNQRRRLKLRISVINQMMMMSEEQLQERCIDIFRSLAKPINGLPSLDYRGLQLYLQQIFKNESIVNKTMKYLSVPQQMNYKQYCDLIMSFNEWSKLDILFFTFYVFQENHSGYLDATALFKLLISEQCFSDDANFISKSIRMNPTLISEETSYHTKLLLQQNLTFKKYKKQSESIIEQIRKSKLEVYHIRTKLLISNIKESQIKEEFQLEYPKQKGQTVSFECFKKIYNSSHPCFFGWLMKCLGNIDIHFIGQKL